MEGLSESSRLLVDDDAGSSEDGQDVTGEDLQKKVAGSERFDLYFGGFSFIIDSLAFVAIGLSKQKWQLYLCKCTSICLPSSSVDYCCVKLSDCAAQHFGSRRT